MENHMQNVPQNDFFANLPTIHGVNAYFYNDTCRALYAQMLANLLFTSGSSWLNQQDLTVKAEALATTVIETLGKAYVIAFDRAIIENPNVVGQIQGQQQRRTG